MAATERIERSFPVVDGCEFEVSNISGSITITGADSDRVHILATKHVRNRQEAKATDIDIGQEGHRVWARTRVRDSWEGWRPWGRKQAARVDYQIELPHQCQVKAGAVSASTKLVAVVGQINVDSVSGGVTLQDLQGLMGIKSVSGNIDGRQLRGRLDLEIVSGKARLADSDIEAMRITSVSGSVRVDTRLHPGGEYSARTVSGNIELFLPSSTDCSVSGHSISGRLRTPLAHTSQEQRFGTWHADVGSGGVPISFHSVSGDLILTPSVGVAAGPASTQTEEATKLAEPEDADVGEIPTYASAMEVLNAIQKGTLTAEEGGVHLRELRARKERTRADH
jgi:hypothetical protein